jgi:CAAX protease family protein
MTEEKSVAETTGLMTQPEALLASKPGVFIGENGLRSGWRLLIYTAIVALGSGGITLAVVRIAGPPTASPGPWGLLVQEVIAFALAFGTAWIMSRFERRPVAVYGLPANEMFRSKFWLGCLVGLMEISVLIGLISAFGGYSFGVLALRGGEIFKFGLLYLVGFTFVGLFEEFLFRGYTQYTLGEGIGFWPAAILLSVFFGAGHLSNPGERVVGAAGVVLVAMLFCFTLKRSGNLWYAVGLHASFDWGETFLFSVPNSGTFMPGHLSNSVLHGAKWLTGGSVGPEGSVFCFLTLGLQFLVVMWLFPAKKQESSAAAL